MVSVVISIIMYVSIFRYEKPTSTQTGYTSIFISRKTMDKALRPDRLELSPNSVSAPKEFKHWMRTEIAYKFRGTISI